MIEFWYLKFICYLEFVFFSKEDIAIYLIETVVIRTVNLHLNKDDESLKGEVLYEKIVSELNYK